MKNIWEKIKNYLVFESRRKIDVLTWLLGFSGIVLLRLFFDNFLAFSGKNNLANPTDLHNFLFFLLNILIFWLFSAFFFKKDPASLARTFLWGSTILILPPIFDMLKTDGSVFFSPYVMENTSGLWRQFITFLGSFPSGMVYFGTRIVIMLITLLFSVTAYFTTRKVAKAISGALAVYCLFFFMASFPSWFFYAYTFFSGGELQRVTSLKIAQFFASPRMVFGLPFTESLKNSFSYNLNFIYFIFLIFLLAGMFFWISREKFWAIIKNFRIPQVVYHSGLFFVGAGLGYLTYPENLNINFFASVAVIVLLTSIWFAWKASVITNDIYDFEIDMVSNSKRPLPQSVFEKKEYVQIGIIFFLLSFFGALLVDQKMAFLLLVYQFLAWMYSAPPFRLKRIPLVATIISASASLVVLFMGFVLFAGEKNIEGFSWRIIFLLLISFTFSLPLKDFKDIEGDRKNKIWTIPVIFGEERGRLVASVGIFISFVLSVIFLNEFRLFWWSIAFGSVSFVIVNSKKINPHNLFWWVLVPVFVYGLILVKKVFLK